MAWAGGTFTRTNGANEWVTDFNNGVGIEPARHDTQDNDLATGINQCLNKDGSNSMTGNLNLNNNIPTNIGTGSAAAPAICAGGDVNTGIFSPSADQIGIATNGVERIRINATGQLGLGTTSPTNTLDIATTSITAEQIGANITAYNTDTARCAELNLFKSNNATSGSNTLVTSGTYLGAVRFYGANGTSFNQSALIAAAVDGTPGATNDMPSRLEFYTTPDASGTPARRMTISSNGQLTIDSDVSNTDGVGIDQGQLFIKDTDNGTSGLLLGYRYQPAVAEYGRIQCRNSANLAIQAGGGNVGIGTSTIDAKLKVLTTTSGQAAGFFQNSYSGDAGTSGLSVGKFDNNSTTANVFVRFAINGGGIGSGQINANGASACAFGTFSDLRLKENVVDLPSQLNAIKSLRPVEFDYKDGSGHQIGFIAQEVQAIYPDLVGSGADDMLTLTDLNKNDARLIKAFQELCSKVDALEARIAELEGA
tara:strand:- start:1603 stop:3042 length:1440 start_codon:yes stop_codon:yes gene_type:complete